MLTLQMGDDVVLAVKAKMHAAGSEEQMVKNINTCEAALRAAFPQVLWLFFEPDIKE